MVIGIGTDVIEIARVRRTIERLGEPFLRRIFTDEEVAYCVGKKRGAAQSFAARFAAKEAAAKALGTGMSRGVSWREFAVSREEGGRPVLRLFGRAGQLAASMGVVRISLSLTHGLDVAMAVVVLEGAEMVVGSEQDTMGSRL